MKIKENCEVGAMLNIVAAKYVYYRHGEFCHVV